MEEGMHEDMSRSQEKAVLALMAKITLITDLSTLLNVVVQEVPGVVGAIGCFIYLQPNYVPDYNNILIRDDKELHETDVLQRFDDFIVLAATNLPSKKALIGKAFFGIGEGLTGWVYKNGKLLRITDAADDVELKSLWPDLFWMNENHDGDEFYQSSDKRPLLVLPLILDGSPIGVLKFHATLDKQSFSEISQEVAVIVSQIISGLLRQTWLVAEQGETISRLIETSNKNAPVDVIAAVTNSMKEMINCSRSEYFTKSQDGALLQLMIRNGNQVPQAERIEVARGQSLAGWVFKTGLPLIISNIREFVNGVTLDDDLLDRISNSCEINDEDRFLKWEDDSNLSFGTSKLQIVSFIAVPVKSINQEVQGVLCGYRIIPIRAKKPFERSQLMLALSFASTISLVLENERQRILSNLLIELGYLTQTDKLFQLVTENIPKLVASSGCSIFRSILQHGADRLKLTYTSRRDLILENGKIPEIEYELGEGKTGMCGLLQSAIVANHYGKGKVSHAKIDREMGRISPKHPNDITSILFDSENNKVGLFQLRADEKLSIAKRVAIRDFANKIIVQPTGIFSQKLDKYISRNSRGTWSFVAVPIRSEDKLLGVITLARPTLESPFSASDVSLLTSISGRLASVMNNIRVLEQRERLIMSLAHELNTPITGVLADSQNLIMEAPANTELQKIAKHNLGQVMRLHMQASAIMSVLSEQEPKRQFTKHSLFLPLKEACELFESEALQNGCNIIGPRARDGSFPIVEMYLFDLAIAFKNIIHNAVKYSFRPPVDKDIHRTIKVWGQWDNNRAGFYSVFIQNYGVGINPQEIEKRMIFEPYYRGERASDRKRTGTGFGLAHARLVIEDVHHGFIEVTSIPQGGDAYLTTFSISLPVVQPK
jgi:signal transduction histidine kinase